MPEIWLGYGDSEVILDIKYENILDNNKPEFHLLDNDSLNLELDDKIKLKNSTLIIIFTPFLQMIPILKYMKGKSNILDLNNVEFNTLSQNIPFKIKRILNDNGITINRIENNEILNKMKNFEKTILLEKIEYDPFFGYRGASTELMRSSFPDKMNHAYSTIVDKVPQPGIITEPLNISWEISKSLNFESIHVIANNNGINSICSEDTEYSFKNAIEIFDKITKKKIEKTRSVFITGNSNFNIQATLSNSLNLLWNNYQAVKENGIIILLSENKMGLGNGALLQFIENRLGQAGLKNNEYKKDLEHINYLNLIKDKFDIYAISTLPKVYLNKLGLKTLSKIKDGLETILIKHGKNAKILIISNSEITRILDSSNQN